MGGPVCEEAPMGELVRRSTNRGLYEDCTSGSFWGYSGNELGLEANITGHEAICEFLNTKYSVHFPHGMHQLYRCFSFWQSNNRKMPVLLMDFDHSDMNYNKAFSGREFYKGIITSLVEAFGVELRDTNKARRLDGHVTNSFNVEIDAVTPDAVDVKASVRDMWGINQMPSTFFAMCNQQHSRILSTKILSHGGHQAVVESSASRRQMGIPRVVILQRDPFYKRSISNLPEILNQLRSSSQDGALFTVAPVAYASFSLSFTEQAAFFHSNDIVVTGHGAQLTAMPFMPKCGSVLELFPESYCVDNYFGSLASASGLSHSYFYMSGVQNSCEDAQFVKKAKMEDFCPPVDKLVAGILSLVDEWKECAKGGE